tara:strand:+ start:332 stop:1009 length:678 start_codon:yes stop_codon:yes gene_type:complete
LKIWKYLSLCICLAVCYSAQANNKDQINQELESRISCKDRYIENLCFLSLDERDNELFVFLSSAAYRMDDFSKTDSFLDAANLAHEVYQSINALVDLRESNDFSIIIIMEVMFKGERVTTIYDVNSTVFVDLDKRIDVYQLLKQQRELVANSPANKQEQITLKANESLVSKYEVTNTYDVVSSDEVKNIDIDKVETSGELKSTVEKVRHTKITHYLVWFPLPVEK